MSLKIAYVTDERYPSSYTDCQQVIKTVDALGGAGCEVHLIAPRMAVHLFKSREKIKAEICSAFHVAGRFEVRNILHVPASNLRIEKLPHGVLGPLKALLGKYDVVHTRNLLTFQFGALLGLPMIYENYKAMPVSTPRQWKTVRRILRRPNVLGMITHSYYAAEVMQADTAFPERIVAVPNGFDPEDFAGIPDREAARAQLGLDRDAYIAAYTGHIRADKGIGTLIDLAEDVPGMQLLLVGGTERESGLLREEAAGRGLSNVRLIPRVPVAEVPRCLAAADALLLPTARAPMLRAGSSTVLPMKVFTYLAAGRPILAPDLPDTAGVLVNERNCLRVRPDDRTAAKAGIVRLREDDALAARLSETAAADALQYTWAGRAKKLIAFMERAVSARR